MDFAALEPDIISACDAHEKNYHAPGYRRCLFFGDFFVKFDDYVHFLPEVLTLRYMFDLTKDDLSAPRVPRVHHFFYKEGGLAYVVMERIQLAEVSTPDLVAKAAQAVLWMRGKKAPPNVVLGPLGSGRAHHNVFKDNEAPLDFTSVQALERYLNQVVAKIRLYSRHPIEDVSISGEELVLTQSDMDPSNFGVDTEGKSVIFDAGTIGWLPESLADYTMFYTIKFAADVAACLFAPARAADLKQSPNLVSMCKVARLLVQVAPANLGLDNDGYPKARR